MKRLENTNHFNEGSNVRFSISCTYFNGTSTGALEYDENGERVMFDSFVTDQFQEAMEMFLKLKAFYDSCPDSYVKWADFDEERDDEKEEFCLTLFMEILDEDGDVVFDGEKWYDEKYFYKGA